MTLYPITTTNATATVIGVVAGVGGGCDVVDVQWRLIEELLTSAVNGDEVIDIDCAFGTRV